MKQKPSFSGDKANPLQPGNEREKMVQFVALQCRRWKDGRITNNELLNAFRETMQAFDVERTR